MSTFPAFPREDKLLGELVGVGSDGHNGKDHIS